MDTKKFWSASHGHHGLLIEVVIASSSPPGKKMVDVRGYMDVSKNRGTPKWMVYNGKLVKMDDLGIPLFSETSIFAPWNPCGIQWKFWTDPIGTKIYPLWIRGWYVYLHEWLILLANSGKCRKIYHTWIVWGRAFGNFSWPRWWPVVISPQLRGTSNIRFGGIYQAYAYNQGCKPSL